jgi:hypothetical protein
VLSSIRETGTVREGHLNSQVSTSRIARRAAPWNKRTRPQLELAICTRHPNCSFLPGNIGVERKTLDYRLWQRRFMRKIGGRSNMIVDRRTFILISAPFVAAAATLPMFPSALPGTAPSRLGADRKDIQGVVFKIAGWDHCADITGPEAGSLFLLIDTSL